MSHQEKQEIFDERSRKQWNCNFQEFLEVTLSEVENKDIGSQTAINQIKSLVFIACDMVQEEQQKRISENAEIGGNTHSQCWCFVNKDSILNPENLIK
ncbi:hypothetical protein [Chryseobacterium sp. SIMBA_028]|uniref:hypothetical protein n=1 Tax=Chryseobacterium sp. SIMBA_028 TaxID=3085771 RepID=UPI00397D296B